MPSLKGCHRRIVCERSSTFPGEITGKLMPAKLRGLKMEPDLVRFSPERKLTLTKLLMNVTIQGSSWPVHVVMPAESTVAELIAASLQQYKKEGRRPMVPTMDISLFDLHYTQFRLERLQKEDRLVALDSRNFFICLKRLPICRYTGKGIKLDCLEWLNFSNFLM